MLAGGIIGVLVVLPRLLVVAPSATPDRVFSPIPGYNSFPVSYITPGWGASILRAGRAGFAGCL